MIEEHILPYSTMFLISNMQSDESDFLKHPAPCRRGMFAPLDPSVNELYAFHGTFVRYALSIAENEACRQPPWFSDPILLGAVFL